MRAPGKQGLLTGVLTGEHRKLDQLWNEVQKAADSGAAAAGARFETFALELRRHIRDEEEILFPGFDERTGMTAGPTAVMRMEHRQMEALLQELGLEFGNPGSPQIGEQTGALSALLDSHDKKEEGMLYPMMDRVFDEEESSALLAKTSLNHRRA